MSSDSPVSDVAEGVTKGFLEWSAGKISDFIKKLKEKKLAFIEEKKTIDLVREQYNSGEAKFYKIYVKDKNLLFLIRMGLTLRKLQDDEIRRNNLREKLLKKYKIQGLHIAEFVENGTLNKYIGVLLEGLISINDLQKEIEEILKNIDKYALFVLGETKMHDLIKKIIDKVNSHSPQIFIVSGTKSASEIVRKSTDELSKILKEYSLERISSSDREILFFKQTLFKPQK